MVVVVVPDDELLDESSFLEQEMMVVAEKHEISKFYNFFSSVAIVQRISSSPETGPAVEHHILY